MSTSENSVIVLRTYLFRALSMLRNMSVPLPQAQDQSCFKVIHSSTCIVMHPLHLHCKCIIPIKFLPQSCTILYARFIQRSSVLRSFTFVYQSHTLTLVYQSHFIRLVYQSCFNYALIHIVYQSHFICLSVSITLYSL